MEGLGVLVRILFDRPAVVVTFVVAATLLVPLAVVVARRCHGGPLRVVWSAAAALGVALVLAVTLGRGQGQRLQDPSCALDIGLSLATSEARANLVLLMPAAFFGYLATRRLAVVLVLLLTLSAGVEAVHSLSALGFCQVADLVRNTTGAVIAGAAAVVVDRAVRALARARVEQRAR